MSPEFSTPSETRTSGLESVRRSHTLLDRLEERICFLNPARFEWFYWNRAAAEIYGEDYQDSQIVSAWDRIVPADRDRVREVWLRAEPHREGVVKYRLRRPDGTTVRVRDRFTLVTDSRGQPVRIESLLVPLLPSPTDVRNFLETADTLMCPLTESPCDWQSTEIALQQSEQRLRSFVEHTPVAVAMFDRQMRYIVVSEQWLKTFNVQQIRVLGRSHYEIFPEIPERWKKIHRHCLAGNSQSCEEDPFPRADGSLDWIRWAIYPWYETSGDVGGIIMFSEIVSDRKQAREEKNRLIEVLEAKNRELQDAYQELKQTQSHLIQAEKMSGLGQLVAGVAHEINNPVNFIFGNIVHAQTYVDELLELLETYGQFYPQPPEQIEEKIREIDLEFLVEDFPKILSSMKVGAERIRAIVQSLRTFSRLDEAEMKWVDLHENIDNTLLILQNRLKAKSERAEIRVLRDYGDVPPIDCYIGQLNQVFMNLIGNAIDAIEESLKERPQVAGKIVIHTEIDGDTVRIQITDNGAGISAENLGKIYDPFYTTKPVGKGTGLGLAISYQIVVDQHRGQLLCESELNRGTTFTIQIPHHISPEQSSPPAGERK